MSGRRVEKRLGFGTIPAVQDLDERIRETPDMLERHALRRRPHDPVDVPGCQPPILVFKVMVNDREFAGVRPTVDGLGAHMRRTWPAPTEMQLVDSVTDDVLL